METDLKLKMLKLDKRWEDFVFCVITCSLNASLATYIIQTVMYVD